MAEQQKTVVSQNAELTLEDGTIFSGKRFGAPVSATGEVVFNTGMVGYAETLTDPSYQGQILVLTYPLIGNYGIPANTSENGMKIYFESDKIHVRALIVSDYSVNFSHFSAVKSLHDWLVENNIPALYDVDTRELTKKLRNHGVMPGKIIADKKIDIFDPNQSNLVAEVSIETPTEYKKGDKRVLLVDCGIKNNILRSFLKRDITIKRVPWDYDFSDDEYDGLFISNGPGDPKQCKATIKNVQKALTDDKPIFGICLGSQIMALAAGADTYKLRYGHRSQNQPCVEVGTKRCFITSQNHGYAVADKTLPADWEPWFVNANDETNEGIKHKTRPFFAVQFHPEATPGPVDTEFLFDNFINLL
ncbi:MAG: glutamine-hydrolyzing carbamoyl-phosphate synthase small subunit [Planctomycetes bacterium]|nr:glutamine-hydrolyzing carbamoyl-phosphate synthase small subunit [Planctomycetota bacterium]